MSALGEPLPRIDARDKVTGAALFAADFPADGLLHAALVVSTIARGRITGIETEAAQAAEGVRAVLDHRTAPRLPFNEPERRPIVDPKAGHALHPLQDDRVRFSGQPVAVVVAETREQALWAAAQVEVHYAPEPHATDLVAALETAFPPEKALGKTGVDDRRGDPAALEDADVRIEQDSLIAAEHACAIEPHATLARWDDGRLTLYDKTQWVSNDRTALALAFGIPPEDVHVVCPYIGGAFGSALRVWPHVVIAAMAARDVGAPVRLELTRDQVFTVVGHRPWTMQRVAIGATKAGRLVAVRHEGWQNTSPYEEYTESLLGVTKGLYACPNLEAHYRVVRLDLPTPANMRAPGLTSGAFALESALDLLAERLDMDPVELRRHNVPEADPLTGKPWSSTGFEACLRRGAEAFGWRAGPPGARRRADGPFVYGQGMAAAMHPVYRGPSSAAARLRPDGVVEVRTAASDMGPGTYTALIQVAADVLGVPTARIAVRIGDSDLPFASVHGGSSTLASTGSAVHAACDKLRRKLVGLAGGGGANDPETLLERFAEEGFEEAADSAPGAAAREYGMMAYGAHFAEVRVDRALGEVRVVRLAGTFAAGRIVNPLLARSQALGGMTMGAGMALMEAQALDHRAGRIVNPGLAEYLVPTAADVPAIDVLFLEEEDPHVNPLGAKGLAELTTVGAAAAVANAVCDATGRRFPELPITPDRVLGVLAGMA